MDCLVLPVSLIRRCSTGSRLRYRPLTNDALDFDESEQKSHINPVTVVVGKEKRVFLVDPFILQANPFRLLMDTSMRKRKDPGDGQGDNKDHFHFTTNTSLNQQRRDRDRDTVIFVDVDAILFEHMLWLMHNDSSSLFQLNLKEIIDFYAQE